MKKPYVSKLKRVGEFKVFLVNGEYIRANIDEEFTNFGQHYRFSFIPEMEFWIDKGASIREQNFYISHLIIEHSLMSKGIKYSKAIEKADRLEKIGRLKSEYFKKLKKVPFNEVLKKVHKKFLKKYSGKVKVWIVRGEIVRDLYFIDFTEGGHDRVYDFVPKGEIWLDDDLSKRERKFVLLHELHERNLMANKKMNYDDAHHSSSILEYFCRKHPKELKKYLKKEFEILKN